MMAQISSPSLEVVRRGRGETCTGGVELAARDLLNVSLVERATREDFS